MANAVTANTFQGTEHLSRQRVFAQRPRRRKSYRAEVETLLRARMLNVPEIAEEVGSGCTPAYVYQVACQINVSVVRRFVAERAMTDAATLTIDEDSARHRAARQLEQMWRRQQEKWGF